jgi:hypothetical protein
MKHFEMNLQFASIALAILVASIFQASSAQAACQPGSLNRSTMSSFGEPSYRRSLSLALAEFAKTPGAVEMNATAGRLAIAVDETRIFDIQPSSFKVEVKIRTSYSRVAGGFGPLVRESQFVFETNPTCSDLNLISQMAGPAIAIGVADVALTSAAQIAFAAYLQDSNLIPINRHAGGHRILIHTPEPCALSDTLTVNILRSHHANSIVSRTSTFLADLTARTISASQTRPGRQLKNLCR